MCIILLLLLSCDRKKTGTEVYDSKGYEKRLKLRYMTVLNVRCLLFQVILKGNAISTSHLRNNNVVYLERNN